VYELYFVARLLEELGLADEAEDSLERAIHLQACRYYRDMLISPQSGASLPDEPSSKPSGTAPS
jgi:hypothetical protein